MDFESGARPELIEAVRAETLRLRPVAPVLFMTTNETVTLGDVEVPAGMDMMLPMRPGALRSSEYAEPLTF